MKCKILIYFAWLNLAIGLAVLAGAFCMDAVAWTYAQMTPHGISYVAPSSDEAPLQVHEAQRMSASKMGVLSVGRKESQECFSQEKPTVVNWLVMINQMRKQGAEYLAILPDISAGAFLDALTLDALNFEFEALKSVRFGRPLRMGLSAEPLEKELAGTRLEPTQIKGDRSTLPEMNQCQAPSAKYTGLDLPEGGLSSQMTDAGELSPPLLYLWDGEVYASFPLLFALDVLGLELKDVRVELGSTLHLDQDHILQIDAAARVKMDMDSPVEISLSELMEGEVMLPSICLLRDDQQELGWAPALLRSASVLIGLQSSTLVVTYEPLPSSYLWLFILILFVEALCISGMQGRRKILAMLLILLQVIILAVILARCGIWMNVARPLAVIFVLFILSYTPLSFLRKA